MKPHASPIIINSYLIQSRRETALWIENHNVRFDEATSTPQGLRAFWVSCEKRMRGVEFTIVGRPGGPYVFRDGLLQPCADAHN